MGIFNIWGKTHSKWCLRARGIVWGSGTRRLSRGPLRRKHGRLLALYLPRRAAKPTLRSSPRPVTGRAPLEGGGGRFDPPWRPSSESAALIHGALHPISVASRSFQGFHLWDRMARAARVLVFDANITPALNANHMLVTVSLGPLWCQQPGGQDVARPVRRLAQ